MDMAALGQRLTSLRLALGKSQQEIANAARVARSYYAQMERGTILSVSLDRIERLGLALGVTRAYLLGDATQATRAFPANLDAFAKQQQLDYDTADLLLRIPHYTKVDTLRVVDWLALYQAIKPYIEK